MEKCFQFEQFCVNDFWGQNGGQCYDFLGRKKVPVGSRGFYQFLLCSAVFFLLSLPFFFYSPKRLYKIEVYMAKSEILHIFE